MQHPIPNHSKILKLKILPHSESAVNIFIVSPRVLPGLCWAHRCQKCKDRRWERAICICNNWTWSSMQRKKNSHLLLDFDGLLVIFCHAQSGQRKSPQMGKTCIHACLSKWMIFPAVICSQKEKMCHKTFDKDPTSIVSIHFNLNLLVCVIYQPFFYAQHVWTKKRCISHFSSFSSWLAMSEQQKIQAEKIAAVNWTDSSNSPAWSLCTKRLQASVETHCNRRIPWDIFTYMNPISSR